MSKKKTIKTRQKRRKKRRSPQELAERLEIIKGVHHFRLKRQREQAEPWEGFRVYSQGEDYQ